MLKTKVVEAIKKYSLLEKGDKVVVACSGGADSVCLVHVMCGLKKEWDFQIFIAHYNHKLRSEAEQDEEFVRELASKYSLPFFSESGDIRDYAKKHRMNLEEAGRKKRYEFLEEVAEELDPAKIATGHTLSDQVETVLMRIFRGTGSHGLGGIRPKIKGNIVRPLLLARREEIVEFLKKEGWKYRVDESNFDTRFFRNKIRHRLIPYLKNNYDPNIVSSLSRLASILQKEDSLLQEISKKKAGLAEVLAEGQNQLDLDYLHTLPKALQRRVVREYFSKIRGDLRGISFKDIDSVIDLKRGKEFHLEKGLVLKNEGGLIKIEKKSQKPEYEYVWRGEKPLWIKETGLIVTGMRINQDSFLNNFDDRKKAFLDISKLKFPLRIRNRRHGDRYRPLGSPGSQKLKELMRAKKIPLSSRNKYPVFLSGDEIVWVLGLPVSEHHKVKKSTEKIFKIEIKTSSQDDEQ